MTIKKSWGIEVIPPEKRIDPKKKYTSNGYPVHYIHIVLYNFAGREVTYPVKGTIVIKKPGKRIKYEYQVWSLDGKCDVVQGNNSQYDLVEVK